MNSILQYRIIICVVITLFLTAVVILLRISRFYHVLILETENMAATKEDILYQCKKKFSNCYRLQNGILNVPVFVDKYLRKIKMGRFSVSSWKRISGELILSSVFVSGCGACLGIIQGNTLGEILPFYIVSMMELYFYFIISGFVDIEEKRRTLKVNLVDYLENHMGNKLVDLEYSIKKLEESEDHFPENANEEFKEAIINNRNDRAELEELLREFLA